MVVYICLYRKQFPASNEIPLLTKPTTNETPQLVQSSSEETSHLVNSPPMSISAHGIPTWQLNEDAEVEQASHREDLNESSSANLKDKNVVTNGNAISDEEP